MPRLEIIEIKGLPGITETPYQIPNLDGRLPPIAAQDRRMHAPIQCPVSSYDRSRLNGNIGRKAVVDDTALYFASRAKAVRTDPGSFAGFAVFIESANRGLCKECGAVVPWPLKLQAFKEAGAFDEDGALNPGLFLNFLSLWGKAV